MKVTYYAVNTFDKYKRLLDHLGLYSKKESVRKYLLENWELHKEKTCVSFHRNEETEQLFFHDITQIMKEGIHYIKFE